MTISESLYKVKETLDAKLAGQIADFLRFKKGANYNQIAKLARLHGIDPDVWESLMYEADMNHD
jgi:hypothetical protein